MIARSSLRALVLALNALVVAALAAPARAESAAADSRDRPASPTPFGTDVYHARRVHLMSLMKKGVGVVLSAGRNDHPESGQDTDFMYLTGLFDERDGAVMLAAESAPE